MAPPPLPSGPALVRATLLAGALATSSIAAAQETAGDTPVDVKQAPDNPHPIEAPTCGPCCHGSADCMDELVLPPPLETAYVEFVGTVRRAPSGQLVVQTSEYPFVQGDVIVTVNGKAMANPQQLQEVRVLGLVAVQRNGELTELNVTGPIEQAPTCGPCCHGGGPECDDAWDAPPDEKAERKARREARKAEREARRDARRGGP